MCEKHVKETERFIERMSKKSDNEVSDGKENKGIFSPKLYINTIKEVFDKFGVNAEYKSKNHDEFIEVTIKIPKK